MKNELERISEETVIYPNFFFFFCEAAEENYKKPQSGQAGIRNKESPKYGSRTLPLY
jgi:hypothetical protein